MGLYETGGYEKIGHGGDRDTKSSSFNIDFYNISFINSFNDLKTTFKRGEEYKGVFTNPATTPSQRNSIVSNASSLYYHDPGYTLIDMIDPFGIPGWVTWLGGEDWKGKISDIDEIRCDGYVEYSYEKSGVIVLGANIGNSGNNNVNKHNLGHNTTVDWWDLNTIPYCPKIQANLAHIAYFGVSTFEPSVVLPPTINNPVITSVTLPKYTWNWIEGYQEDYTGECDPPQQYDCTYQNWVPGYWEPTQTGTINGLQIGVTVSDNGSVSSYLLVQAKLPTESQWHVIRDISAPDNRDWQFKAIPLTSWNGTVQTGVTYISWAGETTDTRVYTPAEMQSCQIKVTAVDQGGNVATRDYIKPPPVIPMTVAISGPDELLPKVNANFQAVVQNAPSAVTYQWLFRKGNGNHVFGSWIDPGNSTNFMSYKFLLFPEDVEMKVNVTSGTQTATATKYSCASNPIAPKISSGDNQEIEQKKFNGVSLIYPNPFNPDTRITVHAQEKSFLNITIYDLTGRALIVLNNEYVPEGFHSFSWNGQDKNGISLASGIYFASIGLQNETGKRIQETKKLTLLK